MKKHNHILLAAAAAALLSGCFKVKAVVNVSEDGSADSSMSILLPVSMITMDGTDLDEALEEMKREYASEYEDKTIETVREGGGDAGFAGIRIFGEGMLEDNWKVEKDGRTVTFSAPLSTFLSFLNQDSSITEELEEETGEEITAEDENPQSLKSYGAEATLTVNMPSKPTANYGKVEGNKVTVDLLADQIDDTLVISCKTGVSPWIIAAIFAGTVLIVAGTAFIFTRRLRH